MTAVLNMLPVGLDANCYSSIYEADKYHDERLHNSNWTSADTTTKRKALIWATRLLDSYMNWKGAKQENYQSLENPRYYGDGTLRGYYSLYYLSVTNSTYQWTQSTTNTNEYYLELNGSGDPSIDEPNYIIINGYVGHRGTFGSLELAEFSYGDNDTLGFDTVYYRPHDAVDPSTYDDDYLQVGNFYEKTNYSNAYFLGTAERIRQATAEYASILIGSDITATSDTAGYKSLKVDILEIEIDKYDRPDSFPDSVWSLLKGFGTQSSGGTGMVFTGRG